MEERLLCRLMAGSEGHMKTEPTTVTIEITTGHCLGGLGNDVYPGTVLVAPRDISVKEALRKVQTGYARLVSGAPADSAPMADPPPTPGVIAHGDPVVASRDPIADAPRRHVRLAADLKSPHKGR